MEWDIPVNWFWHLPFTEKIFFLVILASAVRCARDVQHLMTDQRSINAIDVAEKFANGLSSESELAAAMAAARDAAWAAAWAATWTATWTAELAAAMAAARDAARDAAWDAAWTAAMAAARAAAIKNQSDIFRWVVNGGLTKFENADL